MLRIVLPKGSLEKSTMQLFADADLPVKRSSAVNYSAEIDDDRVAEVKILRPQEIPTYVAEGLFDFGITGRDWVEETASNVKSLGELHYSKATARPVRIVVAVPNDSPITDVKDLKDGVRVSTEYPNLTAKFFKEKGVEAEILLSYGATEAKVPDIVDVAVDLTETGSALRAAGLRIIDTIVTSYTEFVANPASYEDVDKRHAMEQLLVLLQGTLEARSKVIVKMNVADQGSLEKIVEKLPALKAPTVNQLYQGAGFSVETVVPKSEINVLIPQLRDMGATGILEMPITKIVH